MTQPIAFPAFLDLRNRLVIVVGGGESAERKAHTLLKYGADVAVIGANPTHALISAEAKGLLTLERRPFQRGDLSGAHLVFCVETDEEARREVFADADAQGRLVSVPDEPESSNFSTPSVVRRGALQIAISTAGRAPEVAKQVRVHLKDEFGPEWGDYVDLMTRLRESVQESMSSQARQTLLEEAAASDLLERLRDGRTPEVEELVREFAPPADEAVQSSGDESEEMSGDESSAAQNESGAPAADATAEASGGAATSQEES